MPNRIALFTVVMGSLFLACALAAGRPLGTSLTGRELLVQLIKTDGGPDSAGVYAVDPPKAPECVIPFGGLPVWSPEHHRFAYQVGTETHVADLDRRVTTPLDTGAFRPGPLVSSLGLVPRAMHWAPEGDAVYRWKSTTTMTAKGLMVRVVIPHRIPLRLGPIDPLVPVPTGTFSRMDFSRDGARVACEYREAGMETDSANSVLIINRKTSEARTLSIATVKTVSVANPLWCPSQDRLAVDYQAVDGRHGCAIVGTDGAMQVDLKPDHADELVSGVQWSPTGTALLCSVCDRARTYVEIRLVRFDAGPPRLSAIGQTTPWAHQVCWSPEGDRAALLVGQNADIDEDAAPQVEVISLGQGACQMIAFAKSLRPVTLDW